jgi:multidrug efflux pump subunit AcrB
VPLRAVAELEDTLEQAVVTREHLSPTLDVSGFVRGRALSFVLADVEAALEELVVPRGYEVSVSGEKDDLDDAKGELAAAFAIAVVAVYLLLVAQFRSFAHPLTVLLSVPLSISGVALALALAGKPISMPVMVGLVLLVGIVVNNAIILVDFVRQRRDAGMPRRLALTESVRTRFRPIMMTSLSTIVGMIPLASEWALGAERFSPLAIAVIGGMSTATLLTMVVIPVI